MIPLLQELHRHSAPDINVTNKVALAIRRKRMELVNYILRVREKEQCRKMQSNQFLPLLLSVLQTQSTPPSWYLDLGVVRGHPKAHETVRHRQPLQNVHLRRRAQLGVEEGTETAPRSCSTVCGNMDCEHSFSSQQDRHKSAWSTFNNLCAV